MSAQAAYHPPCCEGDCGGTFVCQDCGREVGWCFGGPDDERCDDCWCKAHKDELDARPTRKRARRRA